MLKALSNVLYSRLECAVLATGVAGYGGCVDLLRVFDEMRCRVHTLSTFFVERRSPGEVLRI